MNEENEYLNLVSEELSSQSPEAIKLKASLSEAKKVPQEQLAKSVSLSEKTGLPLDTVQSDQAEAEAFAWLQSMDVNKLQKDTPQMARFLSDPKNAGLAQDDIENLKAFEVSSYEIPRGWQKSKVQDERSALGFKALSGRINHLERNRVKVLQDELRAIDTKSRIDKTPEVAKYLSEEIIGYGAGQIANSGLAAFLGGAATSAAAGLAAAYTTGGLSIWPAMKKGYSVGSKAAGFLKSIELEAGGAYLDYEAIDGIDPDVARGAAWSAGILNGGLEFASELAIFSAIPGGDKLKEGAIKVASKIPGIEKIAGKFSKEALQSEVKALLKTETGRQVFKKISKAMVSGATVEGITEAVQELTTIYGEVAARDLSPNAKKKDFATKETAVQAGKAFVQGGLTGAAAGGAFNIAGQSFKKAYDSIANKKQNQRIEQTKSVLNAIKEGNASKISQNAPAQYKEFVDNVVKDGPIENAYIPKDAFFQAMENMGVDPVTAAEEIGAKNLEQAMTTGEDLVFGMGDFASKLGNSGLFEALQKDVKFDPTDLTENQFQEKLQVNQGITDEQASAMANEEAFAEEARLAEEQLSKEYDVETDIRMPIYNQLVQTGASQDVAESQSKLYSKYIMTKAVRDNISPQQAAEEMQLNIFRPMADALKVKSINMSDVKGRAITGKLIDMIRAGKQPKDKKVYGLSLGEFIREKGGIRVEDNDPLRGDFKSIDDGQFWANQFVRKNGKLSPERAFEMAREYGFFPEPPTNRPDDLNLNDFLTALEQERSGSPTYSSAFKNENLEQLAMQLEEIKKDLDKAGIDLSQIDSNNQVIDLLNDHYLNPKVKSPEVYFQNGIEDDVFLSTLPEKFMVDGVERPTRNSDGKPIAVNEKGLINFWRWFGDSKVVDEQGRPVLVYHGTQQEFDSFDYKYLSKNGTAIGRGFYFSDSDILAQSYGPIRMDVYLKLDKPILIKSTEEKNIQKTITREQVSKIIDLALAKDEYALSDWGDYPAQKQKKIALDSIMSEKDDIDIIQVIGMNVFGKDFEESHAAVKEVTGYDGVVKEFFGYAEDPTQTHFVVFRATQVKSATGNNGMFSPVDPRVFYQSSESLQNDLGFYSQLIKTVQDKMGTSATKEQVEGMIKEIKPEERKWLGIDEFLKGKTKISKQELLDFLNSNNLQIKEITLGDVKINKKSKYYLPQVEKAIAMAGDNVGEIELTLQNDGDAYRALTKKFPELIENENWASVVTKDVFSSDTRDVKYANYQIPGGKNYREVLFTTPAENEFTKFVIQMEEKYKYYPVENRLNEEEYQKYTELKQQYGKPSVFTSSHFSQSNVLAHVRLNDRTDANGKNVLFIEEIQSDWHQAGRKRGYKGDVIPGSFEKPITEKDVEIKEGKNPGDDQERWILSTPNGFGGFYERSYRKKLVQTKQEAVSKFINFVNENVEKVKKQQQLIADTNKVPDAPFRKTWQDFALKRIIRMAAEQGYDSVAWTTGEQQNERYDLSKQIEEIHYSGTNLKAYDKNGKTVIEQTGVAPERLDEYIGKEAAQKLLAQPKNGTLQSLVGQDLKIGGSGMKGFYDKILVDSANKLGKKFGAKVQESVALTNPAYTSEEVKARAPSDFAETVLSVGEGVKVHSLPLTPQLKQAAIETGFPLFQDKDKARGYMFQGNKGEYNIALLEKANVSTFIHEISHVVLFDLYNRANREGNPSAAAKKELDVLYKWFGISDFSEITVEHHEMFARYGEAFLRTGQAPSMGLKDSFRRLASILKDVYRSLRRLNITLNPEVTAVFDRLFATDEELEAVKQDSIYKQLILDAQSMNIPDNEFKIYSSKAREAINEQKDELRSRVFKEVLRERKEDYVARKQELEQEIKVEFREQKAWLPFRDLTRGEREDGTPIKLNLKELENLYGAEFLKTLPKNKRAIYSKKGGADAILVAKEYGYESVDEMIQDIAKLPNEKEFIDAESDRRLREEYGDMMLDGSIKDQVEEVLHNEKRSELIEIEGKFIQRELERLRPILQKESRLNLASSRKSLVTPPRETVRQAAKDAISKIKARDLRPSLYLSAEQNATKATQDALARKDYQDALIQNNKRLLNHYLYKEAIAAKERLDKHFKYIRTFDSVEKIKRIGKAGADYLEQIVKLLEQYEFRKVPLRELDKRKSLKEWLESKSEEESMLTEIDPRLLERANTLNYKELTVDELDGLVDTIKNIESVSRLKNKLLKIADQREFGELRNELIASVLESSNAPIHPEKSWKNQAAENVQQSIRQSFESYKANHLKLNTIAKLFDSFKENGVWFLSVVKGMYESGNKKTEMMSDIGEKLKAIIMPLVKKNIAAEKIYFEGLKKSLTWEQRMAVGLNWGNSGNRQRLVDGDVSYGRTAAHYKEVFDSLSKEDLDAIQAIGDLFESLRPMIAEKQKRLTGVEPNWIEIVPLETKHGVYRGWYYPVKYDSKASIFAAKNEESKTIKELLNGAMGAATTRQSFIKDRAEAVKGRPILLNMDAMFQGFQEVIHDLAWHEWLIDTNRIFNDPKIDKSIRDNFGFQYLETIKKTLLNIASNGSQENDALSKALRHARTGTSIYALGFNLVSSVINLSGLAQSVAKIGYKNTMYGVAKFTSNPRKARDFVFEKSKFVKNRHDTMNREMFEIKNKIQGSGIGKVFADYMQSQFKVNVQQGGYNFDEANKWVQEKSFYFLSTTQLAVDVPTWIGAYEDAISRMTEEEAILYADDVVNTTQSDGAIQNLSQQQTGSEYKKLLTLFYGYYSSTYQLLVESNYGSSEKYKEGNKLDAIARTAHDYALLMVIPVLFGATVKTAILGDDDERSWDAWWESYKRDQLGVIFAPFVGVRELSGAVQALGSDDAIQTMKYQGPAALRFIGSAGEAMQAAKSGDSELFFRKAAAPVGIILHLPTAQAVKTVDGMANLLEGKTVNPTTLMTGKPRR